MSTHPPCTLGGPAACLLLAASIAAQRTWIVDQTGGGDFTDIPPAVAAASPGDTVWVRSDGQYTSPTTSKGLRIVTTAAAAPQGVLVVQGLPAGQELVLSGFGWSWQPTTFALQLVDNAGRVQIEDLTMTPPGAVPNQTRGFVEVTRCADVAFNRAVLYEVIVTDSRVLMTGVRVYGNTELHGPGAATHIAIDAVDSRLLLSGCTVVAGYSWWTFGRPLLPAAGIRTSGGELVVTGGSGDRVIGGRIYNGTYFVYPAPIESDGGVVTTDPDVPMLDGQQLAASPSGTSTFVQRDVPFVLCPPAFGQGHDFRPSIHHKPGNLAGLLVALPSAPRPLPPFGELWLDPATMLAAGSGVLAGSGNEGSLSFSLPIGSGVLPPGLVLSFQAAVVDQGAVELSQPVRASVLAR